MTIKQPIATSATRLSNFLSALRQRLIERNQDIRTLGHSKLLHVAAEADNFENWHAYKDSLDGIEFMHTLQSEYGLSESYADAAWLSCRNHASTRGITGSDMAHEYAKRFNIAVTEKSDQEARQDANHLKKAHSALEDILDVCQQAGESQVYPSGDALHSGVGLLSIDLTFRIDPSTSLIVTVDDEGDITSARVRSGGFGSASVEVPTDKLDSLQRAYDAEILSQMMKLGLK